MNYPIDRIRSQFPALKREFNSNKIAFFDGPGGSQVVEASMDAMIEYMRRGTANIKGSYLTSDETDQVIQDARIAISDFCNAYPNEIVFGQNMTSLCMDISRALSREWKFGDNIVVTQLDHRANVDPWILAAKDKNMEVNWIGIDKNYNLLLDNIDNIITDRTRVVAITHASNGVGTIVNTDTIVKKAHEMGAIVVLDAVHSAPHILLDREKLNTDIILFSAYKFFGPHLGIAVINEDLFSKINPYKVRPAANYIPNKLETGTQNHEALAGIPPVIDFIASLGEGITRREKIVNAYSILEEYEDNLAKKLREGLEHDKISIYQTDSDKTPTIAFNIDGYTPLEICKYLADRSIFVGNGNFYADTIAEVTGIDSWVRVGIAPYNTEEEIDRLLSAIQHFIK